MGFSLALMKLLAWQIFTCIPKYKQLTQTIRCNCLHALNSLYCPDSLSICSFLCQLSEFESIDWTYYVLILFYIELYVSNSYSDFKIVNKIVCWHTDPVTENPNNSSRRAEGGQSIILWTQGCVFALKSVSGAEWSQFCSTERPLQQRDHWGMMTQSFWKVTTV